MEVPHDISGMTGRELRRNLMKLTDNTSDEMWGFDIHIFTVCGYNMFRLTPEMKQGQPRKVYVSFWEGRVGWGKAPSYKNDGLVDYLGDDFAQQYRALLNNRFDVTQPHSTDKHFQLFVLFQFEIARRVEGDHPDLPTRRQTAVAIGIALDQQTYDAHQTLIEMFSAFSPNWAHPVRLQRYMKLRRMIEPQRFKDIVADLERL